MPMKNGLKAIILAAVSTPEQAADEKQSLETQEMEMRKLAADFGWVVVDVLRIPGFSRDYISWEECAADMLAARPPITAMADLKTHCNKRDFDVLMVRDADRLGRTQSLIMQVAETICVRLGLAIYSQMDGQLVEGLAGRFWAAMVGLRAAGDQDKRKKYFQDGIRRNAQMGKPNSSHIVLSHTVLRDQKNGKAIKYIVNEEMRQLFHDMAVELLAGTSWHQLPLVLNEKYGHVSTNTGRLWDFSVLYRTLLSPVTWGHSGLHHGHKYGVWAFDESVPVPDGVELFRNTHEPIYTGELAEQLKSELLRRAALFKGRTTHARTNAFSGLIVCDVCGHRMIYKTKKWGDRFGYYCQSNDKRYRDLPRSACNAKPRSVLYQDVQEWFHHGLAWVLESNRPLASLDGDDYSYERLEQLRSEIETVERRIASLLLQRADTPPASQSILTDLIEKEDARLQALRHRLQSSEREAHRAKSQKAASDAALEEIRAHGGLENFWKLPPDVINRVLFSFLGKQRVFVRNGKIIGLKRYDRKRKL